MIKRLFVGVLILLSGLIYVGPSVFAAQLSQSGIITLSGTVLPGRYIYLDKGGDIQKVVGNTSENIAPKILDIDSRVVPLTDRIASQYQYLLSENGGKLKAGQTYLSDKYNSYVLFAKWVTTNPYFSQKII
jgi:hypothetical protein